MAMLGITQQQYNIHQVGASSEYPATSFTYVGVLWRTRYITIVSILIEMKWLKWLGILKFNETVSRSMKALTTPRSQALSPLPSLLRLHKQPHLFQPRSQGPRVRKRKDPGNEVAFALPHLFCLPVTVLDLINILVLTFVSLLCIILHISLLTRKISPTIKK